MSEWMVSIDIITKEADLGKISRILGISGSTTSHNKGDTRGLGTEIWDATIWKLESCLEKGRSLSDHVDQLLPGFIPVLLRERSRLPKDALVYLNVGKISHTFTCGVSLSADHLKSLGAAGIALDVTIYPGSINTYRTAPEKGRDSSVLG